MSWNGIKIGKVLSNKGVSEQKAAAFITQFLEAGGASTTDLDEEYDDEEYTADEEVFGRLIHVRNALDTARHYNHHQHTFSTNGIINTNVETQDKGDTNGEENNITPEMRKKMKKEAKEQKKAAKKEKKEKKRKRRESKEATKSAEKKPKIENV
mmetsp:Transcript_21875/g.30825  ORF Transcript_21875/g.30825 Transcript_21875/m.30825 type:complete len:154 (+) Transcript_21875:236-697(+)